MGVSQETKESPKPHMTHGPAGEQPCFSICHW